MPDIVIREATVDDATLVVQFLRTMLEEMATMGGHPVANDSKAWSSFQEHIRLEMVKDERIFLIAENANEPVGLAEASIRSDMPIFEPLHLLHIHAVYVLNAYRSKGIGQALLNAILAWGRDRGCKEVELNVLATNPARALYKKVGFTVSGVRMTRTL